MPFLSGSYTACKVLMLRPATAIMSLWFAEMFQGSHWHWSE